MHQPLLSSLIRIWMVLCIFSFCVFGQGSSTNPAGSSGSSTSRGNHVIRGKIFLPSGRLPEQRLRVILEVSSGGVYSETFSDSVGNFEFRSLPNNNYRVLVPSDGRTYESAQENLEVSGSVSRTYTAQMFLREKERNDNSTNHKMISAAEFAQEVPKNARKSYEQGVKKMKDGKNDEAVVLFQDALKIFPDYVQALNKLGETQAAQNNVVEAEATFQQALKISPKYPLTHISFGMLLVNLKRYPEAIEHLDIAINLDESFPMAHINLGIALMEKTPPVESDLGRAEREFQKALALGGTQMANAHKLLFNLYIRRRDIPKAVAALEAYLKDAPGAPDVPQIQEVIAKLKKTVNSQTAKPQ